MKRSLDELSISNFRIFAESYSFKFTDLNIFTGGNNSGKSTIIKAIKLFGAGLEKSDFPVLNLMSEDTNLGGYQNLINHQGKRKNFKIGFNTKIGDIDETFKVVYTFQDGAEEDERYKGMAVFAKLEVFTNDGRVFWGLYASHSPDEDERIDKSVESPSERGDPGLVDFALSIPLLEKYLPKITQEEFPLLMAQLNQIKGKDGYWWGEAFSEADFSVVDYDISRFLLKDLEGDIELDQYANLAEYEQRDLILFGEEEIALNDRLQYSYDKEEIWQYPKFIREVIRPILSSIKAGLDLFRNQNVVHIISDVTQDRLTAITPKTEYLQKIYHIIDQEDNLRFIRDSLTIFGIDGVIELMPQFNSALVLNLITDVEHTRSLKRRATEKESIEIFGQPFSTHSESLKDYENNPRINIADVGKGTVNIIRLILKTAAILFSYTEEIQKNEKLRIYQGRPPLPVIKKTILIEEPEAFLHPNWQSRLIDFFVYCLRDYDVQFIIETHSVYLIQRLQLLVAKGEFDPDKATLLYFNPSDMAEKFYRINIRKDGILKERFGSGFYDETATLTADILNAQNVN